MQSRNCEEDDVFQPNSDGQSSSSSHIVTPRKRSVSVNSQASACCPIQYEINRLAHNLTKNIFFCKYVYSLLFLFTVFVSIIIVKLKIY